MRIKTKVGAVSSSLEGGATETPTGFLHTIRSHFVVTGNKEMVKDHGPNLFYTSRLK